jgi:hypothetical protein
MLGTLVNLSKSVLSLAVVPADAVVDVVTLPVSAEGGAPPFARTARRLKQAGRAFDAACEPSESNKEIMK